MTRTTKLRLGAAAAVIALATGMAFAAAGDDDRPLRGATLQKATDAALEHVGGGTVIETETGDGDAAYGVEIRKDDGSVVEVSLDEGFGVLGTEVDEDTPGERDD